MNHTKIGWAALATTVFWAIVAFLVVGTAADCIPGSAEYPCLTKSQLRFEVARILIFAAVIYMAGFAVLRRMFSK